MSARLKMSLVSLLALTACSYDFENSSEVLDRRILAVQVEPPELVGGAALPDSVQARALVVDPADPNAITEVSWSSCLFPPRSNAGTGEGENKRCSESEAVLLQTSGSAPITSVEQSIPVPEDVVGVLAAGVDVPAPLLQVQVEVGSDKGNLVAVKEVAVKPVLPEGQEPNRNPVVKGLTLEGTDWLPDTPRTVKYGDCAEEDKKEVEAEDGETLVKVCQHDMEPVFDDSEAQYYEDRGFSGKPELQRERLSFSWFTDSGSWRRGTTQQYDPRDPSPDNVGPKTSWREPPTKTGRATVWVVVRDGRGGVTWLRRELIIE
ncbi:hypothetical protein [Hyalangium versicolor]|uniref:hypothetical protein n=1 Tax=Hyalangium versicolor TaxID=2861190 RepID=UPI001CCDE39F|nr:hypothetical protein [Hyalangium versicolor]